MFEIDIDSRDTTELIRTAESLNMSTLGTLGGRGIGQTLRRRPSVAMCRLT